MSIHKSLKVKNRHTRARNVLSREERIKRLTEEERWSKGDDIYGLPKVKVQVIASRKRGKEAEPEAEVAAEEGAAEAAAEGSDAGEGDRQ